MPNTIIKKIVVFFTQNIFGKHLNDDDDDFTFISLNYYLIILLPYYLIFYIYFIFILFIL